MSQLNLDNDGKFMDAAAKKDLDTMKKLLQEEKLDLKEQLIVAVIKNQLHAIELILQNGGNPNITGPQSMTLLYLAILNINPEQVDLLLKYNASLTNVYHNSPDTALDVALQQKFRHKNVIDLENLVKIYNSIIKHGMSLADDTQSRHYKLCDAILKDDSVTAEKLIRETEDKSSLPLDLAVVEDRIKMAELLLAMGANPSEKQSTIFYAIKGGNLVMVRLLCEHGVKLNVLDREHFSPLSRAVDNGLDMVKLLIDYGASVDFAINALHQACILGKLDVVKFLIENKADVNRKVGPMITPLHDAVSHPEIVRYLLDNGAEVNPKNCWEQTPLDLAASLGSRDPEALKSVGLLKERGGQMAGQIWKADTGDKDDSNIFVADFKFDKGRMEVGDIKSDGKGASFAGKYKQFVELFEDQRDSGKKEQEEPRKLGQKCKYSG